MTFAISIAVVVAGAWGALHATPAFAWTDTLTVVKKVVGGPASADDFTIHVKQSGAEASGSPKVASTSGVSFSLEAATYVVSETGGPAGYTATFSGACNASGTVTIVLDESHTCTITNTFQGGTPTPTGTPSSTSTPTATPTAVVNTVPTPTPASSSTPTVTPTPGTTNGTPSPTPGLPVVQVSPSPTPGVPVVQVTPGVPGTPNGSPTPPALIAVPPTYPNQPQPPVAAPPTEVFAGPPPSTARPPIPATTGNAGLSGSATGPVGVGFMVLGMLAAAVGVARMVTARNGTR